MSENGEVIVDQTGRVLGTRAQSTRQRVQFRLGGDKGRSQT